MTSLLSVYVKQITEPVWSFDGLFKLCSGHRPNSFAQINKVHRGISCLSSWTYTTLFMKYLLVKA